MYSLIAQAVYSRPRHAALFVTLIVTMLVAAGTGRISEPVQAQQDAKVDTSSSNPITIPASPPKEGTRMVYRDLVRNTPEFSLINSLTDGLTPELSCLNTFEFPSTPTAIDPNGFPVTVSTCSFAGDYSRVTGAVSGQTLRFASSISGDEVTVRSGAANGPVVATGVTPLTFANFVTGDIFVHWNTAGCGTQNSCRTTTVQCLSCTQPAGALDPTFGTGGKVFGGSGGEHKHLGMALQNDGKAVVAGYSTGTQQNMSVSRLNTDGSPDTTFGGGRCTISFGAGVPSRADAVAVQQDGKIVVAGAVQIAGNWEFSVVRVLADAGCTLDAFATTPMGSGNDFVTALLVLPSGKVVAAGHSVVGASRDFAVAQYTTALALDNTFSGDGRVLTAVGPGDDVANAIGYQSAGTPHVIVAGEVFNGNNFDFGLVQYSDDGTLDGDFGTGGRVIQPILAGHDGIHSIAIEQGTDAIIAAGYSFNGTNFDFALARFDADGSPDTGFGDDGAVTTGIGAGNDGAYGVAVQPDGRIVAGGDSAGATGFEFALIRYNSNGSLDTGFDGDGKVVTSMSSGDDRIEAVRIQPDGRIIAAGWAGTGASGQDAIARYVGYQPGLIQFSVPGTFVNENILVLQVQVSRVAGDDGNAGITYFTSNGTAIAGQDYGFTSGPLNWGDSDASPKFFQIPINDDTITEGQEHFFAALVGETGAGRGIPDVITAFIIDNEPQPTLVINNVTMNEGNAGTTLFTFNVTKTASTTGTVSVNYSTANGSATVPEDYAAIPQTQLNFSPSEFVKGFTVAVVGDTVNEPDENFFINLSNAFNANIATPQGVGTILNDDPAGGSCPQNFDGVSAPNLPAGWTAATTTDCAGSNPWATSSSGLPAPAADSAPNSAFVNAPVCISDESLTSPPVTITSPSATMSFRNNFDLESSFDGMVLEISIGGGGFQDILAAGGSFAGGGYTGILSNAFGNPLGGRNSWTGTSGGFISSTVNLPAAANGQNVVLRWRRGTDSSQATSGVRIDNIGFTGATCAGCVPVPIEYGQTIHSELNNASCIVNGLPTDLYTFSGAMGEQVVLTQDMFEPLLFAPSIELVDPAGNPVQQGSISPGGRNSRIPATGFLPLTATGMYTIRAAGQPIPRSPDGFTAPYGVSLFKQQAQACSYSLGTTETFVPQQGGSFSFYQLFPLGCPPVAPIVSQPAGMLQINSITSGLVRFTVSANPGMGSRTATISVNGMDHVVTQYGTMAPANDLFENRSEIFGTSSSESDEPAAAAIGHNSTASFEGGEPAHAGTGPAKSIWYKWFAPQSGLYSFTTSGSDFNTVMAIYACPIGPTCTLANISPVGSNDDTTSFDVTSKVNFRATQGTQYVIAIDGKNGASGPTVLSWRSYGRLYRLYLQNFNGNASPLEPTSIVASHGANSVDGVKLSLGVYEFDLPANNDPYTVDISGPGGIAWFPTGFTLESQNSVSNATFAFPNTLFGFLRNVPADEIPGLTVIFSSSRGPNPQPAINCPRTAIPGDSVRYDCVAQPSSLYDTIPLLTARRFTQPANILDSPVVGNPTRADDLIASPTPTHPLMGNVASSGEGTRVDLTFTPIPERPAVTISTMTDNLGNYSFDALPQGSYSLTARSRRLIFGQPQSVTLPAVGNVNIVPQVVCTYTPNAVPSFPASGGPGQFIISTNHPACEWEAGSDDSWLVVNSGVIVGNGPIFLEAQSNPGAARQGTIRVSGRTEPILIQQSGSGGTPTPTPYEADVAPRPAGDGFVAAPDVTQVRRFATSLDVPSAAAGEVQRGDCSPRSTLGDGLITSGDVVQTRRYATGLDPQTVAGGPTTLPDPPIEMVDEILPGLLATLPAEINVGKIRAGSSGYFEVDISLESPRELLALGTTLHFDPAVIRDLRLTIGGDAPADAVLTVNDRQAGAGRIAVLVDSSAPLNGKDVIHLSFRMSTSENEPLFSLSSQVVSSFAADHFGNLLELALTGRGRAAAR